MDSPGLTGGLPRWWKVLAGAVAFWSMFSVGLLVADRAIFADDLSCPTTLVDGTSDSNYGTASWSWLPPGRTCTWTKEHNGIEAREGPTDTHAITLGIAAAGLVMVAATRRRCVRP